MKYTNWKPYKGGTATEWKGICKECNAENFVNSMTMGVCGDCWSKLISTPNFSEKNLKAKMDKWQPGSSKEKCRIFEEIMSVS